MDFNWHKPGTSYVSFHVLGEPKLTTAAASFFACILRQDVLNKSDGLVLDTMVVHIPLGECGETCQG